MNRVLNWIVFFCWDMPRMVGEAVGDRIGMRAAKREAAARAKS